MAVITPTRPTVGKPQRPLRRSSESLLGGVCAGLAVRFGVRERSVRMAFSLLALVGGFGVLLYALLWFLLARSGEDTSIAHRLSKSHSQFESLLVTSVIVLTVVLGLRGNFSFSGTATTVAIISAAVAVVIWRGSSSEERAKLNDVMGATPLAAATSRGWRAVLLRVVPGAFLLLVGWHMAGHLGGIWGGLIPSLIGATALLAGTLILLAPWWLRTVQDLTTERRQRMRVEERANLAAHIHDSVLQTLTLIEKMAGNETEVVRLARAQERELRAWLFAKESPEPSSERTFADLGRALEADLEKDYGVKVELVTVGDCAIDDRVGALVAAAREAAINAAKWSGAPVVSIFQEVEPTVLSVFVRDQGCGFDPTAVGDDRHGISSSIQQRMHQQGGVAVVRSAPGTGTEVQLVLPRLAG